MWDDRKNNRRCNLINKEIDGTLTKEEKEELDILQNELYKAKDEERKKLGIDWNTIRKEYNLRHNF